MNIGNRYETAKIVGYTKILSDTATFVYEIKQLDPLSQTLSLSITSDSFFHTLHKKCSKLQPTLHAFLWLHNTIFSHTLHEK
jgi:hypothetical protein